MASAAASLKSSNPPITELMKIFNQMCPLNLDDPFKVLEERPDVARGEVPLPGDELVPPLEDLALEAVRRTRPASAARAARGRQSDVRAVRVGGHDNANRLARPPTGIDLLVKPREFDLVESVLEAVDPDDNPRRAGNLRRAHRMLLVFGSSRLKVCRTCARLGDTAARASTVRYSRQS